jgi:hypothetical protein
MDPAIKMR